MGVIPDYTSGRAGHPGKQMLCVNHEQAFMFTEVTVIPLGPAFPFAGGVCKEGLYSRGVWRTHLCQWVLLAPTPRLWESGVVVFISNWVP